MEHLYHPDYDWGNESGGGSSYQDNDTRTAERRLHGEVTEDHVPSDDEATPSWQDWSASIESLLASADGNRLFTDFLIEWNVENVLFFYLAVNGMKESLHVMHVRIPHYIFNKWLRRDGMLPCSAPTVQRVRAVFSQLHETDAVSVEVFDEAQQEALAYMQQTVHPLFIGSEKYERYINGQSSQNHERLPIRKVLSCDSSVRDEPPNTYTNKDGDGGQRRKHQWQPANLHHVESLSLETIRDTLGHCDVPQFLEQQQFPFDSQLNHYSTSQVDHTDTLDDTRMQSCTYQQSAQTYDDPYGRLLAMKPAMSVLSVVTENSAEDRVSVAQSQNVFQWHNIPTKSQLKGMSESRQKMAAVPATRQSEGPTVQKERQFPNESRRRPYNAFLPPTVQVSDTDGRFDHFHSRTGQHDSCQQTRVRRDDPDELSFGVARRMARCNIETKPIPLPMTELERRQKSYRRPAQTTTQNFTTELRSKLAKVYVDERVVLPSPENLTLDPSEEIFEKKIQSMKYSESIKSPDYSHFQTSTNSQGSTMFSPASFASSAVPPQSLLGPFLGQGARHQPDSLPDQNNRSEQTPNSTAYHRLYGETVEQRTPGHSKSRRPSPVGQSSTQHNSQKTSGSREPQMQCSPAGTSNTQLSGHGRQRQSSHERLRAFQSATQTYATQNRVLEGAITTVLYRYGSMSSEYFMSKLRGRTDLRNFKKSVLSEKQIEENALRFFFKEETPNCGIVFQQIWDDNQMLPLHDGRITATLLPK